MVASGLNDPNLLAALAIPTAGSTYVVGQFAAYVCTCVAVPVPTVTLVAAVLIIQEAEGRKKFVKLNMRNVLSRYRTYTVKKPSPIQVYQGCAVVYPCGSPYAEMVGEGAAAVQTGGPGMVYGAVSGR